MTGRVSEEQQREYLNVMARQADQLVNLVEDLLLSARLDADEVARRRELVAVAPTAVEALDALDPAERDAVEVGGDEISTPVLGDRSHLTRVVLNLLTNALRHGGQHVKVMLGHDAGQVLVAVEGYGPGVPATTVNGSSIASCTVTTRPPPAWGCTSPAGSSRRTVARSGWSTAAVRPRGRASRSACPGDVPSASVTSVPARPVRSAR
ncbi:MAG: HAMP domain-containing sensor histidine kinase [Xanthomonadales bacterium]|nr:HAMP domain-containing sensor histidine kinase [Xanthomonadales bacterium]